MANGDRWSKYGQGGGTSVSLPDAPGSYRHDDEEEESRFQKYGTVEPLSSQQADLLHRSTTMDKSPGGVPEIPEEDVPWLQDVAVQTFGSLAERTIPAGQSLLAIGRKAGEIPGMVIPEPDREPLVDVAAQEIAGAPTAERALEQQQMRVREDVPEPATWQGAVARVATPFAYEGLKYAGGGGAIRRGFGWGSRGGPAIAEAVKDALAMGPIDVATTAAGPEESMAGVAAPLAAEYGESMDPILERLEPIIGEVGHEEVAGALQRISEDPQARAAFEVATGMGMDAVLRAVWTVARPAAQAAGQAARSGVRAPGRALSAIEERLVGDIGGRVEQGLREGVESAQEARPREGPVRAPWPSEVRDVRTPERGVTTLGRPRVPEVGPVPEPPRAYGDRPEGELPTALEAGLRRANERRGPGTEPRPLVSPIIDPSTGRPFRSRPEPVELEVPPPEPRPRRPEVQAEREAVRETTLGPRLLPGPDQAGVPRIRGGEVGGPSGSYRPGDEVPPPPRRQPDRPAAGREEAEPGGSMRVYRGDPGGDLEGRDFPGVFFSLSPGEAGVYGDVRQWDIPEDMRLLDLGGDEGEQVLREYADAHDWNVDWTDPAAVDEALYTATIYPPRDWDEFLRSRGYEGHMRGDNVFVFDPSRVREGAPPPTGRSTRGEPPIPGDADVSPPDRPRLRESEVERTTDLFGEERTSGPEQLGFEVEAPRNVEESASDARTTVSALEGKVRRGEATPEEVDRYTEALSFLRRDEGLSGEEVGLRSTGEGVQDERVGDLFEEDLAEGPMYDPRSPTQRQAWEQYRDLDRDELLARRQKIIRGLARRESAAEAVEDKSVRIVENTWGEPFAVGTGIGRNARGGLTQSQERLAVIDNLLSRQGVDPEGLDDFAAFRDVGRSDVMGEYEVGGDLGSLNNKDLVGVGGQRIQNMSDDEIVEEIQRILPVLETARGRENVGLLERIGLLSAEMDRPGRNIPDDVFGAADPRVLFGISRAGGGALAGAALDEENRLRGAAAGAAIGVGAPAIFRNLRGMDEAGGVPLRGNWYSRLQRAIENAPQQRARGDQWLGMIRKAQGGVSEGELDFTGIRSFLEENSEEVIDQADLMARLDEGGIELAETVRPKAPPELEWQEIRGGEALVAEPVVRAEGTRGRFLIERLPNGKARITASNGLTQVRESVDEAKGVAREMYQNREAPRMASETKFEQYTQPGGENYREILIELEEPGAGRAIANLEAVSRDGYWEVRDDRGNFVTNVIEDLDNQSAEDAILTARDRLAADSPKVSDQTFRSPHWPEDNVLAHARVKDRTWRNPETGEEEKVLFIEEIQSDWHQRGREKGYRGEGPTPPFPDESEMVFRTAPEDERIIEIDVPGMPDDYTPWGATREEALEAARDAWRILHENKRSEAVPDAPFKRTDEWTELAFRRVLAEAAEEGYDRVAWASGRQNAGLYDLRKEVSSIEYMPESQRLVAWPKDDPHGTPVIDETVPPEKLPDYIGKEPAEKLMQQSRSGVPGDDILHIEGEDLAVGGEGMVEFYDRIVPRTVSKYTQKIGGPDRLDPIRLPETTRSGFSEEGIAPEDIGRFRQSEGGLLTQKESDVLLEARRNMEQGQRWSRAWNNATIDAGRATDGMPELRNRLQNWAAENRGARASGEGEPTNLSVEITPEMRERIVNEGQRLGAASPAAVRGIAGAGAGAATGAAVDEENRLRGATTGAALGAAVGIGAPNAARAVADALPDRAGGAFRRWFHHAGDLPEDAFAAKARTEGRIRSAGSEVGYTIADLQRASKDAYGNRTPPDPELERINAALKGEVDPDELPDQIATVVRKMRNDLDAYSKSLIDSGAVQGKMVTTVAENMGTYLNRSYRIFDDPDWAKNVPEDVKNRAISWLRTELRYRGEGGRPTPLRRGGGPPDQQMRLAVDDPRVVATEEERIHGLIDELLFRGDLERPSGPIAWLANKKVGSKDLSILKKRQNIPEEIRALWGEYDDPRLNYSRSVMRMAQIVENHRFLSEVREDGLGAYLFEEPVRRGDDSFSARIAAEGSDVMAPLNGLYTTPEIYRAFNETLNSQALGGLGRTYMKALGAVKIGKTVYSPMTQVRNFVANIGFAVANGHWRAWKMGDAFKTTARNLVKAADNDEAWRSYYQELNDLGVVGTAARAGELRDIIKDAWQKDFDKFTGGMLQRTGRKAMEVGPELYQAGDDVWKIFAFENEFQRYRKALPDLPEDQVKRMAAENVRNTYPTYSMVPEAIKLLRRSPVVGTFVSFYAEAIRNAKNTLGLAAKELKDPRLRGIGAQRLAGILAMGAGVSAVTSGSRLLTGVDRDAEEDMRSFMPSWSENSDIMVLGRDDNGNVDYIDLSYTDPYGIIRKPALALMRGDNWQEGLRDAVLEGAEPFLSQEILTQAIGEVVFNKDMESGYPVYNEQADPGQQSWEITKHVWDAFEPGFVTQFERVSDAMSDEEQIYGTAREPLNEMLAIGTGFRISTLNPRTALYYRAREYQQGINESRDILYSVVARGGTVDEEEVVRAYEKMEQSRERQFTEAANRVQAARRLGLSIEQVGSILDGMNMTEQDVEDLILGRYRPYVPGDRFLNSVLRSAIQRTGDPAQRRQIIEEFSKRKQAVTRAAVRRVVESQGGGTEAPVATPATEGPAESRWSKYGQEP